MSQVFLFIGRSLVIVVAALMTTGCLYQSIGKSPGTWLNPPAGPDFTHISNDKWNPSENALVYFYRQNSEWAADEIESPSVYIDEIHYFNFRSNSYTWLEMSPGKRKIDLRRPLMGLEGMGAIQLSHFVDFELDVKAGKVYYFRYSEVSPPEKVNEELEPDSPLGQGDMQLVTRDMAINEIITTRLLDSDDYSPNHAGLSIAERNKLTGMKRQLDALHKEKEVELENIKLAGDAASWWWPFGGKAISKELEVKIDESEQRFEDYEDVVAAVEKERFAHRGLLPGIKQRFARDFDYEVRLGQSGWSFGSVDEEDEPEPEKAEEKAE